MFNDYGRYAELLAQSQDVWSSTMTSIDSQPSHKDGRTPSLVSLVGQTGAGKSSLIKLMIDLNSTQDQKFCSPVVGASGETDPTSENVHLYADPVTTISDNPIFFADCEGLQGGEREPLGARFRRNRKKMRNPEPTPLPVSERKLEWAEEKSHSSREYAVTHLYPRLLYTFSDVIVFVLRNPRVVENVLEQLVSWAAAALETSSNQPILPHAIIVLNASENDIDESEWDLDNATTKILESLSRIVFKNTVFKKYAQFWRERRKQIETVEQLMLSYYSSIRVQAASGAADAMCEQARQRKADLRMLLDAEELQSYLQCAFDHFAISLDKPFDFVEASFSNSPIPLDFGGNILKLAIKLMNVWENQADIQFLLQELSYMVSSCIMLDSARQKVRGKRH
ncbi:hypothetical protein SLS60_005850 [Paraconiothyrium brasiliense]|uniref:G domain-containing protein n=1 Tax=Paraconiothyrium brasiliense TaxID=300254 RepID=A0ABR3RDD3_9PLEO